MRGARARALSTHLPVTTTSAPSSRARAIGAALLEKKRTTTTQFSGKTELRDHHMSSSSYCMTQFSFQKKFQPHWHDSLSSLEMESNTLLLKKKNLAFCWLQF